ncbi:hypothetical protein VZT92_017899 [Zoarces viviparus]|uniref:Uncharacterized protein n=1 Tax=Zoarces viviparus TaxID=48416 RepID=A0AAW1EPF8_ZOAVI
MTIGQKGTSQSVSGIELLKRRRTHIRGLERQGRWRREAERCRLIRCRVMEINRTPPRERMLNPDGHGAGEKRDKRH